MTSAASDMALNRLREHREAIGHVLARYGANNPRLFGSVAQGSARQAIAANALLGPS